jgi:hypothetical protein
MFGANMGEVIRFVSKSERERIHLIRVARAMYDSVFPPVYPVSENQTPVSNTVRSPDVPRGPGGFLS